MFGVSEWFGPELSVDSYKTWQRHKTHSQSSNLTKLMGHAGCKYFTRGTFTNIIQISFNSFCDCDKTTSVDFKI